jgi:hypothetical protein
MTFRISSGRAASLAGPGHPATSAEVYDCPRVCAMFDKPYIARYQRRADSRFQLVGTLKSEPTGGAAKGNPASVSLRFDRIDVTSSQERCAWCGSKGIVHCGGCGRFLCRAHVSKRDEGVYLRCKCGHAGPINSTVETFGGSKGLPSGGTLPTRQTSAGALPLPKGQLRLKP